MDKQSTQVTQPGSQQVTSSYDSAGRLSGVTHSFGSIGYGYNAATGMLETVTTPASQLSFIATSMA